MSYTQSVTSTYSSNVLVNKGGVNMGLDPQNLQDSQQRLMNMLVRNILNKNGVQANTRNLTNSQKQELRNTIRRLQQQTQQFLNNMQTNVTENDANPETGMVESSNRPSVNTSRVSNKSSNRVLRGKKK